MTVLGIDAGGTKTVCQIGDERGQIIGESRGPGANLAALGPAGVEAVLRDVIADAAGTRPIPLDAICVGMAGVDRPQEAAAVVDVLGRLGHRNRVLVVNDALIALEAGAPAQPGIVMISGTGSIAYGRDDWGSAARAGGWGHVLADEGSGYWLGRHALRAVMREADGRGQPTALTPRLLEYYGIQRARDLVGKIYVGDLQPHAIAALSGEVQIAATQGDAIACGIVEQGARELAGAGRSVARRLGLEDCVVVLAGGTFRAVPLLRDAVTRQMSADLPRATVRPLQIEPASGAVRLALRFAAGEFELPRYVDDL